jgi:dihydroxyacid dehydratase/phosphogluconate dehydratase
LTAVAKVQVRYERDPARDYDGRLGNPCRQAGATGSVDYHISSALGVIRRRSLSFVAPQILLFSVFMFFPLGYAAFLSLNSWDPFEASRFVAGRNYVHLVSDPVFWYALAEDDYRAGRLSEAEWREFGQSSVRSTGTCNTMGTASTMTLLVEVLGLTLPGASSIPAVDAEHGRMASSAGRRLVEMVWEDLTPQRIVTPASLKNAIITDMALSGSTNSFIHLIAMARRLNLDLSLDDFGAASESVPVVCNLMPAGTYLMEDFHFAGGLRGLLSVIKDSLDTEAMICTGRTLGEEIKDARVWNSDVIRPLDKPIYPSGALVVLKGSLAPRGDILKRSAASAHLLSHTGPAVVFRDYADLKARIDDPDLPVTAESVLVLQDAGPIGAPGMPEWGIRWVEGWRP